MSRPMVYVYAICETPGGHSSPALVPSPLYPGGRVREGGTLREGANPPETCGQPPDALRGINDRPLSSRAIDRITAIFSETDRGSIPPSPENVWRHEQVVESLMRQHVMLPARFGTVLKDADALDAVLTLNHDRLTHALDHVRDCIELGVRVLAPSDDSSNAKVHTPSPGTPGEGRGEGPPPATTTGRAYLQARLEAERARKQHEAHATDLATLLHDHLRATARDATMRVLPQPQFLMTAAYLVPRDRADDFRQRVVDLGTEHPTLRLLCTGPWPPYHFVPELTLPAHREAQHV